jgi:hypothetical protein
MPPHFLVFLSHFFILVTQSCDCKSHLFNTEASLPLEYPEFHYNGQKCFSSYPPYQVTDVLVVPHLPWYHSCHFIVQILKYFSSITL